MVFTTKNGTETRTEVYDFPTPGIAMGMYNTDEVIK